jgi:hypothetical protein
MNYSEIDKMIERFFEGDTSLEEERILRDVLSGTDLPEKYKPLRELFAGLNGAGKISIPDRDFEKTVIRRIKQEDSRIRKLYLNINWYWVTGIAATVIITVILLTPVQRLPVFNLFSARITDTFDDPQKAYAETVKALLMVSDKMNSGTGKMKSMGKFNQGMEEAGKMTTFNRGVSETDELDKLNGGASALQKLGKMSDGIEDARKLLKLNTNQLNSNNL